MNIDTIHNDGKMHFKKKLRKRLCIHIPMKHSIDKLVFCRWVYATQYRLIIKEKQDHSIFKKVLHKKTKFPSW